MNGAPNWAVGKNLHAAFFQICGHNAQGDRAILNISPFSKQTDKFCIVFAVHQTAQRG